MKIVIGNTVMKKMFVSNILGFQLPGAQEDLFIIYSFIYLFIHLFIYFAAWIETIPSGGHAIREFDVMWVSHVVPHNSFHTSGGWNQPWSDSCQLQDANCVCHEPCNVI